jgi:molybdopterin converting factor small subunit
VRQGATVGDAFDGLANSSAQLETIASMCALAVDGKLASRETSLHDGCTIAILPPVSGG